MPFSPGRAGSATGSIASLNCGYRLARPTRRTSSATARSRWRCSVLPADRLVTCRQVHSAVAVIVEQPWSREDAPRADAMATNVPGLALGVLAADCAPVLLCDPVARVIGAAHAGWRGAFGGVVEATVEAMERARRRSGTASVPGSALASAAAPTRSAPNFRSRSSPHDPAAERYFAPAPRPGHFLFDLAGYVEHRLACCGVSSVERAPSRHRRRRGAVLQLSPRLSARRAGLRPRPLGHRPRRLKAWRRLRDDHRSAMPYLILFLAFCFWARSLPAFCWCNEWRLQRIGRWQRRRVCCCWPRASRCRILLPTMCQSRARRC